MAIDAMAEELLPLTEAAALLPRRRAGRKTSTVTLYRWSSVGLKGIILETVQLGSMRCTTKSALSRFFDALTERYNSGAAKQPNRPKTHTRKMAIRRAEARLAKAGIRS